MATRSVALHGPPGSNWSGCYAGGYAGVAWGRGPVDTFDPSTNGQPVFGPPPLLQTTFYNSSAGESAKPAPYSYNLGASGMGGGTLGCNWQHPRPASFGASRPRPAYMRLSATVNNPYNLAFGFNDTSDTTTVGNWYSAIAGRLGYTVDRRAVLPQGRRRLHPRRGGIDRSLHHHRRKLQQPGAHRARQRDPGLLRDRRRRRMGRSCQKWSVKAEYLTSVRTPPSRLAGLAAAGCSCRT